MSTVCAQNVLTCKGDVYGGVTVKTAESIETDFNSQIPTVDEAREKLVHSIEHWKKSKINGVWFEVDIKHSFWVPILVENGFTYHHAQPNQVTLTRWLPEDRPSSLPKYPFTSVGVGGVVEDANGRILLMKERRGLYLGWKFPGGLSDPNESIADAVVREVFEETGIETVFGGVLMFRHLKTTPFYKDTGDLYFVCYLKPKDESKLETTPCPNEAAAAQWLTREQIRELPRGEIHEFHHAILERLDAMKTSGRRGCYLTSFDPKRTGWKPWDLYQYD
ncbi:Nudix hydrolase 8 [Aphelenchoides besseyi]|nr:Nudix hydrolase 8 [Aphelenchoides besseyi]KAI6232500.1 Nudix hydrolase 8 [Aphelenchoides besseyi]